MGVGLGKVGGLDGAWFLSSLRTDEATSSMENTSTDETFRVLSPAVPSDSGGILPPVRQEEAGSGFCGTPFELSRNAIPSSVASFIQET